VRPCACQRGRLGRTLAERWIRTAGRECLDHSLIHSERHLLATLREYVVHASSLEYRYWPKSGASGTTSTDLHGSLDVLTPEALHQQRINNQEQLSYPVDQVLGPIHEE
jgi:hypothetical protein